MDTGRQVTQNVYPKFRAPAGGIRLPVARKIAVLERAGRVKGGGAGSRSERTLDAAEHSCMLPPRRADGRRQGQKPADTQGHLHDEDVHHGTPRSCLLSCGFWNTFCSPRQGRSGIFNPERLAVPFSTAVLHLAPPHLVAPLRRCAFALNSDVRGALKMKRNHIARA